MGCSALQVDTLWNLYVHSTALCVSHMLRDVGVMISTWSEDDMQDVAHVIIHVKVVFILFVWILIYSSTLQNVFHFSNLYFKPSVF